MLDYDARMKNLVLSIALFVVAACGGNSSNAAPPSDPSSSSPGATGTSTAPAEPGDATGSTGEPVPATLAPTDQKASTENECGPVATPTAAPLSACLAECEKLADTVPAGAKCMPPRFACKSHCNTKFKE